MSEAAPEAPASPEAPATAPEAPQDQPAAQQQPSVDELPEWAREALSKANKEAAGYRTRLREVEPLAQRAQELEEAQKTEAQRVADRAAAAERERDEARADGLRYKAAARHGISEDYFDLLGSGDEEAIQTRAERIGGLLKLAGENEQLKAEVEALRAGKPVPTNGRPTESLRSGAVPTTPTEVVEDSYPDDWLSPSQRAAVQQQRGS